MAIDSAPTEIADLIELGVLVINDGYRAKNSELGNDGLPFARGGNIDSGFHFETADRFPKENLARVGEKVSRPGDAVFTSKGTVGRFVFVSESVPQFVYSPQLCFWRSLDYERIDPRWLFYWMQGTEFFSQYSAVKGESDMADYVNLRDQRQMYITLPEISSQRVVAHILGSLDDKIEINRRMNATLEAMAQAIFKSWFVDFDPVRAKMEGRQPIGMDAATTARFPDRLVDTGTELGMIPEGWEVKAIGDVVKVLGGSTPSTKTKKYWVDGTNYFCTPKDMSTLTSPILLETDRLITDSGVNSISSGQLPAGVVLMSSRAPVGYLVISQVPISVNQGIIAMVCETTISNYYALNWAKHHMEMIKANANGSTFMEISKRNFRPLPILDPGVGLSQAFNAKIESSYEKIAINLKQSQILATLRDTLLPRLMSGELRVRGATE